MADLMAVAEAKDGANVVLEEGEVTKDVPDEAGDSTTQHTRH